MKTRPRQPAGVSLPEVVTAAAVIAVLLGLAIPSIRALNNSYRSTGAGNLISAALAGARATAAQHQRYAGLRFQFDNSGCQYIIPIIHDSSISATAFRAIEGKKPLKLPENLAVMDLRIVADRNTLNPVNPILEHYLTGSSLTDAQKDDFLNDPRELTDTTTFSIIFSPSGRLIIHGIRVEKTGASDTVFNERKADPDDEVGMFYEDAYFTAPDNLGIGPEPSRRSFVVYDKIIFKDIDPASRWTDYLHRLEVVCINPYTGTIIE